MLLEKKVAENRQSLWVLGVKGENLFDQDSSFGQTTLPEIQIRQAGFEQRLVGISLQLPSDFFLGFLVPLTLLEDPDAIPYRAIKSLTVRLKGPPNQLACRNFNEIGAIMQANTPNHLRHYSSRSFSLDKKTEFQYPGIPWRVFLSF
jgi:hypothetical protein